MARFGTTNKIALGMYVDELGNRRYDTFRVSALEFMVRERWNALGKSDPLKVFVKQEPHKMAKIQEGRYRLISAVSLVDTMIDRILFRTMWAKALSKPLRTPSAVGWVPLSGGWRSIRQMLPGRTVAIDKSAWDWTVQELSLIHI